MQLRTNLVSSAVSDDGDWLALSDLYETKLFRLEHTPAGGLAAHRVKTFLQTLEDSESLSHLSLQTTGTGSSALLFTPNSQRLIMALTGQQLLVIALPRGEEDVRVMECFAPLESAEGGRVIVQGRLSRRKEKALKRAANGHANGEDVEMEDASAPNGVNGEANGHSAEKEKDDDEDDSTTRLSDNKVSTPGAWRVCLAASEDGQWLASSDLLGRVAIYNLDTLRVSKPKSAELKTSYTRSCLLSLSHPVQSHSLLPIRLCLPFLRRQGLSNSVISNTDAFFPQQPKSKLSTRLFRPSSPPFNRYPSSRAETMSVHLDV